MTGHLLVEKDNSGNNIGDNVRRFNRREVLFRGFSTLALLLATGCRRIGGPGRVDERAFLTISPTILVVPSHSGWGYGDVLSRLFPGSLTNFWTYQDRGIMLFDPDSNPLADSQITVVWIVEDCAENHLYSTMTVTDFLGLGDLPGWDLQPNQILYAGPYKPNLVEYQQTTLLADSRTDSFTFIVESDSGAGLISVAEYYITEVACMSQTDRTEYKRWTKNITVEVFRDNAPILPDGITLYQCSWATLPKELSAFQLQAGDQVVFTPTQE